MAVSVMDDQNERKNGADRNYRSDMHRRQRRKNIALALALAALMLLFYIVAIVRISGS